MDAQLPSWLHRIAVFDLETTGVDVTVDRIVTAHVGVLNIKGRQIAAREWLADPGIAIPASATAIHGVSTEYARAHGRPAGEVIADVTIALRSLLAQTVPVVAYNASFDLSLLAHEAARHGVEPLRNPQPVIDPLVIDKTFDRYRPGKRTLAAVAAHYAVSLDTAHDASADAVAAGRIAQALAKQYPLPETATELHTKQISWARAQAASLSEYFIKTGRLDPEERLDGTWPIRGE